MEKLKDTLFYTLEKSIKAYRQFAQKNINELDQNITIDQWLVLKMIQENKDLTQSQLSTMVFKDYASVTRMINRLVEKKFLTRSGHPMDRRRFELKLTEKGNETIEKLLPVIRNNRKQAMKKITKNEMRALNQILRKIIHNCT